MKKIVLLTALISCCSLVFSQTLFTYGSNNVSKEEFLKAYNKNKTSVSDEEKSLREYLDLYINFKLKVEAAKKARLDTLPQLQYDIQSFRNQIQDNYLNNEAHINELVNEAFARSQRDIHIQHFIMLTDSSYLPFKALDELDSTLKSGNDNYEQLAKDISEKYKSYEIKTTDLGYITAFSVPYEFENIIYSLKPGQSSKYYMAKSSLYAHVFKVIDERPAMGKWKIAQILLAVPPGNQAENLKPLKSKADSIYQLLKNGADFSELAKQFSDDKLTYLSNGKMPEFGCGKYDLSFEEEVIQLKNDGDISLPFFTTHGFHIVKRISQTPISIGKGNTDEYLHELKQKVLQDARINAAKDKFTKNIIKQIGYKKNAAVKDIDLFTQADNVSINKNLEKIKNSSISNTIIFSFGKNNIKGSEWLNFINTYKNNPALYKGESNDELLQKFINISALEYYKQNLEKYNPQFALQIKEFKEGNMLFEIMERNVWSKASSDNNGLKKYYIDNKNKYLWAPSADIIIFNCANIKAANKAVEAIQKNADWKKTLEENGIQTDSGRYELSQIPVDNPTNITAGFISAPVVNISDNTASFVKVLKLYPANQQRSFEEAKGLLINDFQAQIEEQWVAALKNKYPVKINEAVFKSIIKK
ncbi:MAG: peptidylprolyl isomerase [Chitinophagaceae bacterium]|nr:peptidylprolyl isomerase [Chitinophagaceae bacterium]